MKPASLRRRSFDEGNELIEFSLVIIPLLAFLLLIMDGAWIIFAKASLQEAVREGVRYAITGQGGDSSIQQTVAQYSFGFIPQSSAGCYVSVQYFAESAIGTPLSGVDSNAGGNVVQINVSGITISPLGPLLRSATPITLSAVASDVMESSPNGVPPSRGTPLSCP